MKNNINKHFLLIGFVCSVLSFTACNIAGLDLQQDAKYNATPLTKTLNMTAFQFIESRKNIDMSLTYEAIKRSGFKDSFEVNNRTYIVLNDIAFIKYLASKKYANVNFMPVDSIAMFFKRQTILGKYSSLSLTTAPLALQTADPNTKLALSLLYVSPTDNANKYQVQVRYSTAPLSNIRNVVTSNINPTNGIIHVLEVVL